ncbi:MAG: dTDP-6-deoxy-3,4-keto-hexulose isomerase, partial [Pricia sp.]|nr:dTDP-6-deoxy-3,4-keto-hexulose isomerase [Pricia sp.]
IRAWQAHTKEKKWFYCNSGAFVINLIELDNFEHPSDNLKTQKILLNSAVPMVLEISGGYANGFKATQEGSKLLVFSNFSLDESKADDFRYPADQWSFEP